MGVQGFSILIIVGFDTEVYMLLGRLETDLSPAFFFIRMRVLFCLGPAFWLRCTTIDDSTLFFTSGKHV